MIRRNFIRSILGGCVAAGCAGCEGESYAPPPPERVAIVYVGNDEETGYPDEYTIVEFPDGQRRFRFRVWGEVGDEFAASKFQGSWQ